MMRTRTYTGTRIRTHSRPRAGGVRAALPAALLTALALAVAGCGSGDDTTTTTNAAASKSAKDDQGVKFAQCLREHGVDVDDPEPGQGIQIKINGNTPKSTVEAAMEACRKYDPMQQSGASADPQAEAKMRKMAQCMRDNGVENFPDPESGKGIQIDGSVANDPDFTKADKKCQKYAPTGGQKSNDSDGNG